MSTSPRHETIDRTAHEPQESDEIAAGVPRPSSAPVALEMVSGAAVGAIAGAIAGPPGVVVGALVGSLIGTGAALAAELGEADARREDEELDRAIGVTEGNIGEPLPDAPPAKRRAKRPRRAKSAVSARR